MRAIQYANPTSKSNGFFGFGLTRTRIRPLFLSMDVQVAVLCDAATDYAGKLNLLGTFDTIVTHQLPAVHPQCSVALRIVFSRIEEGQHKVRMNLVDEDGRAIMPGIELPADVVFPNDGNFLSRNFIINIQHLKFEKAGHYAIDIAIDGRHEASIPLQIRQLTPAAIKPTGTP
jgi:hypothetical protein